MSEPEKVPETAVVTRGAALASAWFIQNSLDAFVGLHGDNVHWANDTWAVLTGWTLAETAGRPYSDFVHPDERQAVRAGIASMTVGERRVTERRIAAKSGDWLSMEHHAVGGDEGWILMILRDVTAERQRELDDEEARRVSAMVRTAAGVTPWRYDAHADEYLINPDFIDHNGGDRRSAQAVRANMHDEDRPKVLEALQRAAATGEAGAMDYRDRDPDGLGWRQMRATWHGVRPNADGRWDVLGIVEDITALTEARDAALRGEKAARAAAEAKSQFLANISHEFRTPMNGVLGILHLMAEPDPDERRRLLDKALSTGMGLAELLNDIIDYSDVEAGRLELKPEVMDPCAALAGVVASFQAAADAKRVELRAECEPGIGWVTADETRLSKIFGHLVGNAVKFTPGGAVAARLSASGAGEARRLRLEVEDTGIGVPAQARGGLFERFNQVDSSTTRRYGGPGLGLAITRRLAELMGGAVGYAPRDVGGSIFWVEVAAPAVTSPAEADDEEDPGDWLTGLRVLVVEDNATNRLVATRMLDQLGAMVSTADNGAEGVAAVEQGDFDLIFMDIQMPVMDGVEASRRIRAMASPKNATPIVATTANVLPQQLASYRDCGINGVVAKPISPAALLTEVARVTAEAEAA